MHLFQYFRKVTTGEDLKKAKENVSIMLHTTLCLLHVLCNACNWTCDWCFIN